jgi:hypothetical protein
MSNISEVNHHPETAEVPCETNEVHVFSQYSNTATLGERKPVFSSAHQSPRQSSATEMTTSKVAPSKSPSSQSGSKKRKIEEISNEEAISNANEAAQTVDESAQGSRKRVKMNDGEPHCASPPRMSAPQSPKATGEEDEKIQSKYLKASSSQTSSK